MTSGARIPIYFDDTDYTIIDSVAENAGGAHLYPSSAAAQKLYRCIECMRDINEVLEAVPGAKSTDKKRRRLKILFTPLFSFIDCLFDLLHDIQNNPVTTSGEPPEVRSTASAIEERLKKHIPYGTSEVLREVRNKMSAHADKDIYPTQARELFAKATPSQVGLWLHSGFAVFADLLKLPIYQWSCKSKFPDCVGILSPGGPILTILRHSEGVATELVGCYLVKRDPRNEVIELVKELADNSRWMFGPGDPQIRRFVEDAKGSHWAKSLETLPDI